MNQYVLLGAYSADLFMKADKANPTFTGTVTGVTKSHVGLGNVDNTSDANKPVSTAQQTALNLKAPLASPAFTGTPTGITKAHVGLSNVDNTSDDNKPVSTAQNTAINLKSNNASPVFTGTVTTPNLVISTGTAPATATSAGTKGQIAYASGFLYVCVATNTWQRVAIATW